MIEYRMVHDVPLEAVKNLYQQHGWLAYLQDDAKLLLAFHQSLYTIAAYDGEELAGLVRCVGDGEHIVLVQDLIVAQAYQRKGIGRELMRKVNEHFSDVRMLMLVTDALDERANAFYQAIGMIRLEQNGCVTYMK